MARSHFSAQCAGHRRAIYATASVRPRRSRDQSRNRSDQQLHPPRVRTHVLEEARRPGIPQPHSLCARWWYACSLLGDPLRNTSGNRSLHLSALGIGCDVKLSVEPHTLSSTPSPHAAMVRTTATIFCRKLLHRLSYAMQSQMKITLANRTRFDLFPSHWSCTYNMCHQPTMIRLNHD